MAGLWMLLWIGFLTAGTPFPGGIPPVLWHAREMVFGFTMAVVAGFVLTAAQNWTGLRTTTPAELAALVGLWLGARLGFLFPQVIPPWLTSILDLALLPAIAVCLARALWLSGNRRNYAFIPLLAAFTLLNAGTHLVLHGLAPATAAFRALDAAILLITVLLVFMGGRVIPFFTDRRLPEMTPRQWPWLNWSATLSVLACALLVLLAGRHPALGPLLLLAATLNMARLLAWQPWRVLSEPLLWVLHLGYAWVPVGLALLGTHLLWAVPGWSAGTHVLMVGAMGTLTLGMMARVALGHSGRLLRAPAPVVAAFGLITLAAALRLAAGAVPGPAWLLGMSGALWATAFLLYALTYAPILLRPRLDHT